MAQIEQRSAFSADFLDTVRMWFEARPDVFVVARYSATAGAREYFWFKQFETFRKQLDLFPPQADIIIFRDDVFPLRGIVNDDFISQALELVSANTEAMLTNMLEPPNTDLYFWTCDSHAEMLELLHDFTGKEVSIGYPAWWEADNDKMISALIPLPDGTLKRGVY